MISLVKDGLRTVIASAWLPPAIALAAGLWLLAPSVAWYDSGELAAAAVQLGVPHPTGFPAWVLGGHAFSRLPLANGAVRVHLWGAFAGIAAAWIWLKALNPQRPKGFSPGLAESAAVLLPWSVPALALHMRAAEVYAPAWLICAAALWVATRGPAPRLPALALLAALGGAVHVEAALIPLGLLIWTAMRDRRGWRAALLLAAIASLALLYLPLAAQRAPGLNWGNPRDLPALWDHLTAASIRAAYDDRIGNSGGWATLGRLLADQGRWLAAPAAIGLAALARQRPSVAAATAAVMTADALYSALVNPMGLRDQQAGLLVLLGAAVLAAHGLGAIAAFAFVGWPRSAALAQTACLAGLLLGGLGSGAGQADLRAGARYADSLLRHAQPDQLLVTSSDHASSACQWLQTAEGSRPDALCLPAAFLRDDRATRHLARQRQRPELLPAVGLPAGTARTAAWLTPFAQRGTVAWEPGLPPEDSLVEPGLAADLPFSALAPLSAQARRELALALPDTATRACADITGDPQCAPSPTLQVAWSSALAVFAGHWSRRDPAVALVIARAAVHLQPSAKALGNLAALEVEIAPALALAHCRQALQILPDYVRVHRTCARAAVRAGRADLAREHALAALPTLSDAKARAAWLTGLRQEASPELRQALPAP